MALNYGDISEVRIREIYQSDIKSVTISSPVSGSDNGSPIDIVYVLESDLPVSASVVDFEFSTNGVDYSTCTEDLTSLTTEGTTTISADDDGNSHTFSWDSATDLTTAFQSSTVTVRVRAADQNSAYSEYATSSSFTVDMLPGAPTIISPPNLYFDSDTTPDFIFTVPTDPGSDKIHFAIDIDDSSDFTSIDIAHNSQDNLGRFMHRIETSPGTKNGAASQAYYVKAYTVSAFSTAVTFASLTDHHKDTAVPTTLTNPQILLINRADRRCFIDPSTITGTGFTIEKSAVGVDTNGIVDIIIFSGAAGTFESYWVDIAGLSTATAYTYGVAPFDTDELGNTIPGTIADCRPLILEGNDCPVYISSVTDTGFTLNLSSAKVDTTATVRVCLRVAPSDAYIHTAKTIAQFTEETVDTDTALDDSTNGGAAFPAYIPGNIITGAPTADRLGIFASINNDGIGVLKSAVGVDSDAIYDIHSQSEPDGSINYWTDIPTGGIPDSFEGDYVRYRTLSADALSIGYYAFRVKAANAS